MTEEIENKLEFNPKRDRMFFINGKSFRCPCGGNVFRQYDEKNLLKVKCNSCGDFYIGE